MEGLLAEAVCVGVSRGTHVILSPIRYALSSSLASVTGLPPAAVDAGVEELVEAGGFRRLQGPVGEETVVVRCADLTAHLNAALPPPAAAFAAHLLAATPAPVVSSGRIAELFAEHVAAQGVLAAARVRGRGEGVPPSRPPRPPAPPPRVVLPDLMTALVKCGLLARVKEEAVGTGTWESPAATPFAAPGERFWLCLPGGGGLWTALLEGRRELLRRVTARKFHEAPREEVEAMVLQRCPLPARLLLRDSLGCGVLRVTRTAAGEMVRVGDAPI